MTSDGPRGGNPYILLIIPVLCAAYYLAAPSSSPLVMSDTISYINFDPDRPIGYPAILAAMKFLTGGYASVRYLQIIAFCAAAGALGSALWRSTGSMLMALIVEAGVLGHPGPINLAQTLITDSLSATFVMFFAAALLYFSVRPSIARFAAVCAMAAIAITLRPVNIALVPVTAILAILFAQRSSAPGWRIAAVWLIILAMAVEITPLANHFMHPGVKTSTPLARGLIQKALFLRAETEESDSRCKRAYIENFTKPVNEYLDAVPADLKDLLKYQYSQVLRFSLILPGLEKMRALETEARQDDVLMCYTLLKFRAQPMQVLGQTAHEYWDLISNYTFITNAKRERYLQFVEKNPPIIPRSAEMPDAAIPDDAFTPPKARPWLLIAALKTAQLIATVLSAGLIWYAFMRRGRPKAIDAALIMGLVALSAQAILGATSVVEMAQPRYFFPVWPLLWAVSIYALFRAPHPWRKRS